VAASPGRKVIELLIVISGGFIHVSPRPRWVQMDSFLFKAFACPFTISPSAALICTRIFNKVCWHWHIHHIAVGVDLTKNFVVLAGSGEWNG